MTITTLDGLDSGKYVVTTYSGTQHFIDLDAKTVIRRGAPREWGEQIIVNVTPDGEAFHFTSIQDVTVGKRMRLDNADEWRVTSTIQSIVEDVASSLS